MKIGNVYVFLAKNINFPFYVKKYSKSDLLARGWLTMLLDTNYFKQFSGPLTPTPLRVIPYPQNPPEPGMRPLILLVTLVYVTALLTKEIVSMVKGRNANNNGFCTHIRLQHVVVFLLGT